MNQALKVSALDEVSLDTTEIVDRDVSDADNDTPVQSIDSIKTASADEIRAKIKAARLEKLMARQLESELSSELTNELETAIAAEIPEVLETEITKNIPAAPEREAGSAKVRSFAGASSKRIRDLQASRNSCEDMMARVRSGTEVLSSIGEQTMNLSKQLQFMEQEFVRFEEAEIKANNLALEHRKIKSDYEEAINLTAKQNRQIEVLETLRNNSVANYESTKQELEKLQRANQKQADAIAESELVNSELEQTNRTLQSKLTTAEQGLEDVSKDLQKALSDFKQKDMEAARTAAELMSAKERLGNAEAGLGKTTAELETLSIELNKKDMELSKYQSDLGSLTEKFKTSEAALERTTRDLEQTTQEVNEKDMAHAKAASELSALIKSNEKTVLELTGIQNKYDELNKHALEQQSQQYARIHELESTLRDVKRQLELKAQEKAELAVELEATNNLLVLHEEMVAALSPDNNR